MAFCFCFLLGRFFEFVGEGDVVEEGPGVVEFAVPRLFQIAHGAYHTVQLFIADQRQQRRRDSRRVGVVCCVVVRSPQGLGGFFRLCLL